MASIPSVRPAPFAPSLQPDRWVTILDAYIIREMSGPFLGGLAAFLLFWFINIFFLAADYVINQHAPIFLVLRFLLFRVPQSTPMAFPFACLLGTLLAFGRLTADNEIMAMRTSGVPFMRIARTPVLIGIGMFLLSYVINENIVPIATDMSTRTFYQIIYKTQTLPVEPGLFRKDPSSGRVFYVGSVDLDGKTMHDVMIFEQAHTSQFREVTTAQTATVDGAELRMQTAVQTRFKPDGRVDGVVIGHDVVVGLPLGESADSFLSTANNDPYTMDAKRLSQQIKLMEATGQGGTSLGLPEDHAGAEAGLSLRIVHRNSHRAPARGEVRKEGARTRHRVIRRRALHLLRTVGHDRRIRS